MVRLSIVVSVLVAALGVSTAWADEANESELMTSTPAASTAAPVRITAGHTLVAAAEIGTTNEILGHGFRKDLSPNNPEGKTSRVYPSKITEVPVDQYRLEYELIENSFQLDAHGRYLFVRAGVKNQTDKRYMVLRASHINKIAILEPEGEPQADSDLYANKIYYGWALYVVIEGDKSSFTADVEARLRLAGAGLYNEAQNNRLRTHIHTIGLQAKNPGEVVIATTPKEIQQSFKTPDNPVPIFVEYMTRREITAEALPWDTSELKPGRYQVNIAVEVLPSKADGRAWDGGGSPPDPVVMLYVDGKHKASCKQQDSFSNHCLSDLTLDIHASTYLQLFVFDKDLSEDDHIGGAGPFVPLGKGRIREPIKLKTSGQVKRATITFHPLN